MYETLELTRDSDGIATLTLDRPQAMNSWNAQLAEELRDAVATVAADDEARVLLLTGRGRAFCAGADVKAGFPPTAAGHWDVHTRLIEVHDPIILGLREMPKPAIAVVRGAAAGIGCSLALACDLVLAAESAYFMLAFIGIGFAPDGGASAFVAARAGVGRATEMAMLGEPVPAPLAVQWGLANRAVPDERLDEEALALARRLAAGPTKAYAARSASSTPGPTRACAHSSRLEADEQQRLAATRDNPEGVAAFVEKRPASFHGR